MYKGNMLRQVILKQIKEVRRYTSYANLDYIQGWNRKRNRMKQHLNGLQEDYVDEYENEYLPRTDSVRVCPECGRAMYYGYCRECLEDRIKNNSKREY
tara:strand:- start:29557 stop:29850 length:294 start_codon:yes stop_codon:yes gene_type:complete